MRGDLSDHLGDFGHIRDDLQAPTSHACSDSQAQTWLSDHCGLLPPYAGKDAFGVRWVTLDS